MYNSDFQTLHTLFEGHRTKRRVISIPEYAESTIIPSGKYRGVKFSNARAPYLVEPLRCLSPESPIQEVRCQFPAQTGKSTIGELAVMFYVVENPSEILYITSDERAGVKWMQRRIEPRAKQAGVEFRAEASTLSRRTGDTAYSKEFPGGNIDIASALSVSQMSSESKRVVIADETDRWRLVLGADGLTWDVMYARTQAWGDQKKILAISTPTLAGLSIITQLYEEGDQRLYYVPCPYCGTMQLLDFAQERGHGLAWNVKGGRIEKKSLVLVCESPTCRKEIREVQKGKMLLGGQWRATAVPADPSIASFHINGLYSPFISWYDMARGWEASRSDPQKRQTFENLKMGLPYIERGSRPKVAKVLENRGTYRSCTIPDGVLFLTAGVDVQEGSETHEDRARLEMTVLGVGSKGRTWVIEHRIFHGPVLDPYAGAWTQLSEYLVERIDSRPYQRSDGRGFLPVIYFIDSGSGKVTDTVYNYCAAGRGMFPSKGFSQLKQRKTEKPDEMTGRTIRYRAARVDSGAIIYEINTNYYKDSIYRRLAVPRQDTGPQRGGFVEFPHDLEEKYFDQLTAEERRANGSFHNPGGRRNEALDCFVMALCASDVWLWSEVLNYRAHYRPSMRPEELQAIDVPYVLNQIEKATARRAPVATE